MRSDSVPRAGLGPLIAGIAGMLVWAAHFAALYFADAILCARGLGHLALLGVGLVPILMAAFTLLALAALGAVALRARRGLRHGLAAAADDEEGGQFTAWLGVAATLLAALAVLWQALPALMLPACG